jgi:D-alpha,beta-D-heptose 7-phosphate 1-kinase (EC 2.7.1.-)/D-beta-D-heptose 1-phosphate adenylyltransferase (EC 2.7.7.-)
MIDKLAIIQQKILDITHLSRLANQWHLLSKKIVFTNGCFDIIHQGHNHYLLKAAELGDVLVVAVNTDDSVRRLKGPNRPIVDEYSRAFNLACHTFIDAVILFDEDTPLHLIQNIRPHVLVKGGDYTPDTVVGAEWVQQHGGEVHIIPFLENYSTTNIIEKIVSFS